MKGLSAVALAAIALAFVAVAVVQAKKPLYGTMDLEFNLGHPGAQAEIPDWVGTVTINGKEYGMLFWAIGNGKSFIGDPPGLKVHFFEEIWAIYDLSSYGDPPGGFGFRDLIPSDDPSDWSYWLPCNSPPELVLFGGDQGITNLQNSKYHMNGNVEGAFGDFEDWQGRNVHMSGDIVWQTLETPEGPVIAPYQAPGTFRIN
jgi:hypothetical protein